jgi:peptidoglycan hydrolase-like protein with peptidoglycan-binding domain
MKLKRSTLAAVIVGGSLGIAASSAGANDGSHGKFHSKNDGFYSKNETLTERYPKSIEDDSDMAPGVPGVTELNPSDMTRNDIRSAQQKLAAEGYDVARTNGAITNDFRAAIREFQKDNGLVITGSLDSDTAELLGVNFVQSSG